MLFYYLKNTTEIKEPQWVHILPKGNVEIDGDAPAVMDDGAAADVMAHFRSLNRDMVIDYEHQTLSGNEAPAAGWIKELQWRQDGLWGRAEWTENAQKRIDAKEYRYHSPVFMIRKGDRKVTQLYNLALTNQPRMKNIRALVNKLTGEDMDLKEMIEKLGLPADADKDKVLDAVGRLVADQEELVAMKKTTAPKEVTEALGLKPEAGKSEIVATILALKQGQGATKDMATELQALKQDLSIRKRDDLVSAAIQKGKITPAQKEWAEAYALTDPAGFAVFIAKAPVVVPVDGVKLQVGKDDAAPEQAMINKLMGVNDETFKKYAPKE